MVKKGITALIAILFLLVVFSGCTENNSLGEVTGDTNQIQIIEHETLVTKNLKWSETRDGLHYNREVEVPWELNVDEISQNLELRKNISLNYIQSANRGTYYGNREYSWNAGYTILTIEKSRQTTKYHISDYRTDNNKIWNINGTAKNIGNEFLEHPTVTVNFYNEENSWLASEIDYTKEIPVGYTWAFQIKYEGKFSNDVNYISFNVEAS